MTKTVKKIAIVMDEIDGMNNGDKGGITALIKMIRQKKTKKQKLENKTLNPIICIGNYYVDKKIKELMKVCNIFELKTPTNFQINQIVISTIPTIHEFPNINMESIIQYIQGDVRKLIFILDVLIKSPTLITEQTLQTIFNNKSYNEDSKKITQFLINNPVDIKNHNRYMNETERTIVALLWHENIVDVLEHAPNSKSFPQYLKILNNMCYADYIDRITFQNQIWQFNEMSSLIKTFYNNQIVHKQFPELINKYNNDMRFTKVLTKYSTEYNNIMFIYNLSQELDLDKKDLLSMFQKLRMNNDCSPDNIYDQEQFEHYNITKLDIKRIYRFLDKNIKKDSEIILDDDETE
jgi:hypothetical protein